MQENDKLVRENDKMKLEVQRLKHKMIEERLKFLADLSKQKEMYATLYIDNSQLKTLIELLKLDSFK